MSPEEAQELLAGLAEETLPATQSRPVNPWRRR
jgi:hypothetical protein